MSPPPAPLFWKTVALTVVATLSVWATHRLIKATEPGSSNLKTAAVSAPADPHPFLRQWCYDCHGDGSDKGGLSLDTPDSLTEIEWDKIRRHVVLRTMPPDDKPTPPPEARAAFEESLLAWQASRPETPPLPPVRRLNRREFIHSLRDLLGTAPALSELPDEETAHGFDNNADLQPLPPPALERYLTVTRATVRTALLPAPVPSTIRRYMPQEFTGNGNFSPDAPAIYEIETADPIQLPVTLPIAGRYRFTLRAYAHQAGDEPVGVSLLGRAAQPLRSILRIQPEDLQTTTELPAGRSIPTFNLTNPFSDPRHPNPHRRTRRLLVHEASLEGPLEGNATPSPAFVQRFGPLPGPDASLDERLRWADRALGGFAHRAWRRPLSLEESARLTRLAGEAMAHGLRDDESLVIAVQAVLTSPHFLFLPEPSLTASQGRAYAVGARLSYLLWSTLPDETLLAECATPWTPSRLAATARRMLGDARAGALARDFAGQWLQLRNTTLTHPDATLFPEATPEIRQAIQKNTEQFFLHLVRENEPVLRLLDADYTFLENDRTGPEVSAEFPTGTGYQKKILTDPNRRGLLGQPAVLMFTSYPNRTSPVLRGKYVLEALLGLEPPPPPPNIPTLQPGSGHGPRSVRAALELHRADRACAACHRAIDPLGFPLEAFDAIGRPSGAPPADLISTTFTGTVLHQPADLAAWLIQDQGGRITGHAAERLLTYALGRGLTAAERLAAQTLVRQAGGRDARFQDLLIAVLTSPAFRGESDKETPLQD